MVEAGSGEPAAWDARRFEALRLQSRALTLLSAETIARARAVRHHVQKGRSQREILHDSAYARLQAKMSTMAVIEQAKGIVMAQQRCGPEAAFDLLRQMSQSTNVKVHVLAAHIVEQIAASDDGGTVVPISPHARRSERSGRQARPSPR